MARRSLAIIHIKDGDIPIVSVPTAVAREVDYPIAGATFGG